MKIDFGGGQRPKEGFTNVDLFEGADVKHDLFTFPYPFGDGVADEVHASHFIEHLPMEMVEHGGRKKDMLEAFMDEMYRILKVGGKCYLVFPNCTSTRAFQDPTHRRFIPEATVLYFNKGWRVANGLDHCHGDCDFDFVIGRSENASILGRNDAYKAFATTHHWNVVDDLHFILTKIDNGAVLVDGNWCPPYCIDK
jgi:hypothetical protein